MELSESGYAGSYVVIERRQDGTLVLAPESVDSVVADFADRVLSEDEHEELFRRLDTAADRQDARPV